MLREGDTCSCSKFSANCFLSGFVSATPESNHHHLERRHCMDEVSQAYVYICVYVYSAQQEPQCQEAEA